MVVALAAATGATQAQVMYSLNGGTPVALTPNPNQYHIINLEHVVGDLTLHIYDDDGFDDSLDRIILRGTADPGAIVKVKVANEFDTDAFNVGPNVPLDVGLRDFAGLVCEGPLGPTDPNKSLRDRTVVSIAVAGDITGDVEAGLIYRVDALRRQGGAGGRILGDVRAVTADADTRLLLAIVNTEAIAYVRAATEIAGTVQAVATDDPGSELSRMSIDRIIVGPLTDAAGITGNIICDQGFINSIWSSGPIGTSTAASQLRAGKYIREVRTVSDSDPSMPLDRDMYVSIDTRAGDSYASDGPPTPGFTLYQDGGLTLIETAGDIHGSIRAGNLTFFTNNFTPPGRSGIFAGGAITAPITIDFNMENADIIASSIEAPVTIGVKAKGAIVATDDVNGLIESVDIGYTSGGDADRLEFYRENFPSGFVGNDCPPMPAQGGPQWYGINGACAGGLDVGTVDSVIRAKTIGTVRLKSMTEVHVYDGTAFHNAKAWRPRVEAAEIDVLEIGAMRFGMVWSGLDETPGAGSGNDIENDYAQVNSIQVGCVGAPSDLWVTGFEDFRVGVTGNGDVKGEIHLPVLAPDELMTIDGGLVKATVVPGDVITVLSTCGCAESLLGGPNQPDCEYLQGNSSDEAADADNPRWRTYGMSELLTSGGFPFGIVARQGTVNVYENQGLHGQIVIDALNGTGAHRTSKWTGIVRVASTSGPSIEFATTASQPYRAPIYTALPSAFGGGAVGLVPFTVHQTSSDAINSAGNGLLTSEWNVGNYCSPQKAVLDFYGPVKLQGSEPYQGNVTTVTESTSSSTNVTAYCNFFTGPSVVGATFDRRLAISPLDNVVLPNSVYTTATPSESPSERLLCDLVTSTTTKALSDGSFTVQLDCPTQADSNWCMHLGTFDCIADLPADCTCFILICDSIDFNNDGLFPDNQDLVDFVDVFGGAPCPTGTCNDIDFNNDGLFPDNIDIEAIFSIFGGGPCIG